jgi:hypothetical protein
MFPGMKHRIIQPLLRLVLALLCVCLVASPQSAKAELSVTMIDHDWTVSVGSKTYGLQGITTSGFGAHTWTEICLGDCSLRLEKDFRTVASGLIAKLLLIALGTSALLSISRGFKPKPAEQVQGL